MAVERARTYKRKSVRYKPDNKTIAYLDTEMNSRKFEFDMTALVINEAFKGCGLICLQTKSLQVGDICRIKIEEMSPLHAEVRWREELSPEVLKVGFEYIE